MLQWIPLDIDMETRRLTLVWSDSDGLLFRRSEEKGRTMKWKTVHLPARIVGRPSGNGSLVQRAGGIAIFISAKMMYALIS